MNLTAAQLHQKLTDLDGVTAGQFGDRDTNGRIIEYVRVSEPTREAEEKIEQLTRGTKWKITPGENPEELELTKVLHSPEDFKV